MTPRVLMVCTGNICRSTMAHQVLVEAAARAGVDVVVDSAGVSDEERGNPIDRRAARVLREAGYRVPGHRARQVTAEELPEWDLVLAMTDYHLRRLQALRERSTFARFETDGFDTRVPRRDSDGELVSKPHPEIRMFRDFDPQARPGDRDLPDPWYGGHQDFVETLEVIERSMPQLLEYLRAGE